MNVAYVMPKHYPFGNVRATPIPFVRMYSPKKTGLTGVMDIYSIRRANLAKLVRARGGPTRFAEIVDRSQSQVSQLLTQKPMGSRIARNLEESLGLPSGWMDHYVAAGEEPEAQPRQLTKEQGEWLALFERLPPKRRADLSAVGRAFLEPDDDAENGDS